MNSISNNSNEKKLKAIQDEQTKCLSELHQICQKENLHYSMAFGTMLGAFRHGGHIPWDDDMDICMPYLDCQKLKQALKNSQKYFFQDTETDPFVPFTFYKVRINGTRMVQDDLKDIKIHHGIWIDIFPYFNASKYAVGRKIQYALSCVLQMIRCKQLNQVMKKRNIVSFLPDGILAYLSRTILYIISRMGQQNSYDCFVMSNDSYESSFVKRDLLENIESYKFGNYHFWGPKDYDFYLRKFYGKDYMIPKKWAHLNNYADVII